MAQEEGVIPEEPNRTDKTTVYILDSHRCKVHYQFLTAGMSNREGNACEDFSSRYFRCKKYKNSSPYLENIYRNTFKNLLHLCVHVHYKTTDW